MSAPTVSVIVPAYNARATILPTVTSALEQSHAPVEIIVVDDGSTDDTASIASSLPIPVRVIRKPNGGPASARNVGALAAIGEWLAFLDADDIFLPDNNASDLFTDFSTRFHQPRRSLLVVNRNCLSLWRHNFSPLKRCTESSNGILTQWRLECLFTQGVMFPRLETAPSVAVAAC